MLIEFRCSGCDKLLRTSADKAGMSANCPECGELVDIPTHIQSLHDERFPDSAPGQFAPLPSAGRAAPSTAATAPAARFESRSAPLAPLPTRPCPVCGESIAVAAILCRFCRSSVGTARPRPAGSSTNGLAITSLVMGISSIPLIFALIGIPLGFAAVTTGLIACKQCRRGQGTGTELAIIGIVSGAIPTLLGVAFLAMMLSTARM